MKNTFLLAAVMLLASCATPASVEESAWTYTPKVDWRGDDTVTLPLATVSEAGHLDFFVLTLSVNGRPAQFMVDSGTNKTWFTKQFTEEIAAKNSGLKVYVHGAGGSANQGIVYLDVADLGFAQLHGLYVTSGNILEDINRSIAALQGKPIAGILGLDILVPLGASIDLAQSTITFRRLPNPVPTPVSVTPSASSSAKAAVDRNAPVAPPSNTTGH